MKGIPGIAVSVALAAALAANAGQAHTATAREHERMLEFRVAVAEAPGDIVSDAVLLHLDTPVGAQPLPADMSPDQQQRIEQLRARHQAAMAGARTRVDAVASGHARVLSFDRCIRQVGWQGSDCEDKRRVFEAIAGDNAYFHLLLASHAWLQREDAAFLRHLQAAAAASSYDDGFAETFAALRRRMQHAALPSGFNGTGPAEARGGAAMAQVASIIGGPDGLFAPCREATAAGEPALRQACHAIARRVLQGASTTSDLNWARALLGHLGTPQEQAEAAGRARRAQWWNAVASEKVWTQPPGPRRDRRIDQYWDDLAAYGELGAIEAVVRRAELPPDPPADFDPAAWAMRVHRATVTPP